MTFIKGYIANLQENEGLTVAEVARKIGVSSPMVSAYKNNNYMPSISVAKRVWMADKIALHPFSGESLQLETKDL